MTGRSIVDEMTDAVLCAEGEHHWWRWEELVASGPLLELESAELEPRECVLCGHQENRVKMDAGR